MKKKLYGIALIALLGIGVSAQQSRRETKVAPEDQAAKTAPAKKGSQDDSKGAFAANSRLQGELQKSLDVKKAKVGDEVVLKTTSAIKQEGQVVIPKGSRLIGRVTEVKQRTKEDKESRLGLLFDRLEGKGLAEPISASIISITDARAASSAGDLFGSDISGSSSSSARASSGGGLLGGGGGGGLLGGATSTVGGVLNTTTSTVGNVAGTATNTVAGTTQQLGGTLRGIQLSSSSSASASGSTTLSTQSNNLRLEKGVTFNLLVTNSVEN